jgi:hypothetical protein
MNQPKESTLRGVGVGGGHVGIPRGKRSLQGQLQDLQGPVPSADPVSAARSAGYLAAVVDSYLPTVLLFRGRGILSSLIRWQTRSAYSHAAIHLGDGAIIESWQGAGVRRTWLRDWSNVTQFGVRGMTGAQWRRAIDFAEAEIGAGYDYLGVVRFVSRRRLPLNERWFCSELVFAALEAAGVRLLERTEAAEVSPGMLALSPYLEEVSS